MVDTVLDQLTDRERRLLEVIRELGFGELKIVVQNSEPVRIEELIKSIKL